MKHIVAVAAAHVNLAKVATTDDASAVETSAKAVATAGLAVLGRTTSNVAGMGKPAGSAMAAADAEMVAVFVLPVRSIATAVAGT
jgi:hypothetical protein